MEILLSTIQIFIIVSGCLAALLSVLLFLRLHWPSAALWSLKLLASAFSPVYILIGSLTMVTGWIIASDFITFIGLYNVLVYAVHLFRVTRPPDSKCDINQAFGLHWEDRINNKQKIHFLRKRIILFLPHTSGVRMEQNIVFSTVPDSGRQLLCDIWQPPVNTTPSGLAFIYLHGGAWYLLDKDLGTRPFFNHLAAQGHVIMDVAYRLAPETDMTGMVHDVKRAIVWLKENASDYHINPDKIALGGGSAGAHLALLSAYTANNPLFTPQELEGKDLSVSAVISLYGPADLEAMYYHTNQHLTTRSILGIPKKPTPTQLPEWIIKKMGKLYSRLNMDKGFVNAGAFAPLLGGHPDACPERYAHFSPLTHVHLACPPTLLIHGEHDILAPVNSTRILQNRLLANKVKTVMHILPQTDHAFDLIFPGISPSAHNAYYDVERFLAQVI